MTLDDVIEQTQQAARETSSVAMEFHRGFFQNRFYPDGTPVDYAEDVSQTFKGEVVRYQKRAQALYEASAALYNLKYCDLLL